MKFACVTNSDYVVVRGKEGGTGEEGWGGGDNVLVVVVVVVVVRGGEGKVCVWWCGVDRCLVIGGGGQVMEMRITHLAPIN